MSSSRIWPLRLKERCEAVGWTVGLTKRGHYRVRVSGGSGFSFASTSSDYFAERKALGDAKRYGLLDLESKLARRRERGRQERIAHDRGVLGEAFANAVAERDEHDGESKEEGDVVAQKEVAQTTGALGYVDDVAIAEKAPAMHTTPISHGPRPLTDGEELLLADGRIVYRCVKPAATVMNPKAKGVCHRTFDTVNGLKGHITFHSRTTIPIPPGVRKKREREARERVARVTQAAAARRSPAQHRPFAEPAKLVQPPTQSPVKGPGVIARMVELTVQFERFQGELEIMSKSAHKLATELHELARLLPDSVADESTLEKVKKYEELRRLIS